MERPLSLYELTGIIRNVVEHEFSTTYWITAEVSDVHGRGKHCFFEFVEKDSSGTEPLAKARGVIWSNRWCYLKPLFEGATGSPLSDGMQILAEVEVTFHEKYGFSLNVINIDPTYTLGDIARRRREIIEKLKSEGVFDLNKSLPLPRLITRIAVISASGAAGYQDFCNQLSSNHYGLHFKTHLFEATMQGSNVESSVIQALDAIASEEEMWDVVVIIRGGGSTSDLRGFDSLSLAENIAQFPLPIITGIGHERDNTVIDEVSHTRVKTPTAAAEFLITHQYNELMFVNNLGDRVVTLCSQIISDETLHVDRLLSKLPTLFTLRKEQENHRLNHLMTLVETSIRSHKIEQLANLQLLSENIRHIVNSFMSDMHSRLQMIAAKTDASDPIRILRLGYSISRVNGKAVRDINELHAGDKVYTTVANGTFVSTVNQAKPEKKENSPFNIREGEYLT